jgi:hypothetical protein
MAIAPSTEYPSQTDADSAYPHGKARNAGSYQDGTGTPLEKKWLNDLWGFLQALLVAAEITPSGDPDTADASQYLDAVRAVSVDATSLRNLRRGLALRSISVVGLSPFPSSLFGGVVSAATGDRTVYVKAGTNGAFAIYDNPNIDGGSVATVTGLTSATVVLRGGTRIVAAGDGGSKNAVSTTVGTSWSAGGSTGLSVAISQGVWNGTRFIVSNSSGKVAHSTTAAAWTNPTAGNDLSDVFDLNMDRGLAALASGTVFAAGAMIDNTQAIATSTDDGDSWSMLTSIPSSDYVVPGYLAGNGGSEIYWLGKPDAIDHLDFWVSSDGAVWEKRSEIAGFEGAFGPKLLMCQDTGLLLAIQDLGSTLQVAASIDRGRSWTEPVWYSFGAATMLAVANGRVFAFLSGSGDLFVMASDRL